MNEKRRLPQCRRGLAALLLFLVADSTGTLPMAAAAGPLQGAAAQPAEGGASAHTGHAERPDTAPGDVAPIRPAATAASAGTSSSPKDETPEVVNWFPGGQGLFVPPFYDRFNGIDLSALDDAQRERFIHWVNTEYCTCGQTGCQRDTIANCYTNDSRCPRAPVRIREILEKVKKGESLPGSSSSTKPKPPRNG